MEETYTDEYGVVFSADRKTMLKAPQNLKEYSVPDGTQHIGNKAFSCCDELRSVVMPDSVITIGMFAFCYCGQLETVVLPKYLTKIPLDAFSNCKKLKGISIPSSVTIIEHNAFKDCEGLQEIVIPESVQKIESDAFSGCKNIKHATIYGLKKYIGGFVFEDSTQVDIIVDGKPLEKGTVLQSRGRYECIVYEGHIYKGEPNGFGKRILETMSGTERIDAGYYYDGKFVTGPGFDEKGRRHGDGYFHGLTDEEFDEIWHDCN